MLKKMQIVRLNYISRITFNASTTYTSATHISSVNALISNLAKNSISNKIYRSMFVQNTVQLERLFVRCC